MAAVMRGLEAEAYDRQYSDRDLVRRIGHYFGQHRRRVIIVAIAVALLALLGAAPPLIIARGVAVIAEQDNPALIPWLVAAVFAAGLLVWLINWVSRLNAVQVIEGVVLAMRRDAFGAAARQDLSFFDDYSAGRIVSRITSDTEEFGRIVQLTIDVVQQLTSATLLLMILFRIEWRLTLVLIALSPFVVLAAISFRALARRVTRQSSRVLGEVNKSIQEAVTGIGVAKNFRQEQKIYDEFIGVNDQAYAINLRRGMVIALIFPTLNVLLGVGTALLVYFGGRAALAGIILISAWYLFIATVDRFWFPLLNLSAFWSQFQQGLSAAERVFALIDAEPSVAQSDNQLPLVLDGAITFDHVTFRYTERETVLDDFSLTIRPGETIALVGHTGAGKSSIIKLVSRFYEFQEGTIALDGRDIRSFDLAAYRSQLGIVSQIPFLFDGSVAENIRYGRLDASDAEIAAVCNQIGDGEWLETLPNGLNSAVGERGARLSMGQRQLVALARVLVTNPRIFILDEATANIDPFTEAQIQSALSLIMRERTSIVIAHRLSTVRSADRIIVLRQGRIIEQGSHAQLIAAGGHYAELYNAYFRHQSLDYINERGWERSVARVAAD